MKPYEQGELGEVGEGAALSIARSPSPLRLTSKLVSLAPLP
jgi:hypothetical protein